MAAEARAEPAPHRNERFIALDSWRGIAAIAIVFRHINGTAFFLAAPLHENLSYAVDFFFVLSGFVISASYGERLARGFSLLRFMVLRWGRVWPLHAVMVGLYFLLETALWLRGTGGVLVGRDPFTGPRELAALPATLLLMQTWFWPGRDLWNTQSWSISVEIALYIGSALLWRRLGARAALFGLLAALAALWVLEFRSVPTQMLSGVAGFGLGMACWHIWPRVRAVVLPRGADSLLELALLAAVVLALSAENPRPAGMDALFAAAVLVFAREEGVLSRLLLTGPARMAGTLSYALYMVHGLVVGRMFDLAAMIQSRFGQAWVAARLGGEDRILLAPLPALLLTLAMIGAALLAAWIAWALIEWPARGWSRRLAARIGGNVASGG